MSVSERDGRATLVTQSEAAELLGVPYETISEYVGAGLLGRVRSTNPQGLLMYLYAMEELIAFDLRFPRDAQGRRSVKTRHRADRNIVRRRSTDGRMRYQARVRYTNGPGGQKSRTFATLEAARRWRDKMEAERDGRQVLETLEPTGGNDRWWSRLTNRISRRPWEVAS